MADIRLSKIIKQYNIGLQDLVDFLNKQGAGIEEANPNLKVSDEYMVAVAKQSGKLEYIRKSMPPGVFAIALQKATNLINKKIESGLRSRRFGK